MEENVLDNLLILKKLDKQQYFQVYWFITKGKVKKIKTKDGIAVNKQELQKAITESQKSGRNMGYAIDLSRPSKINCLYKRLVDMNISNKQNCQRDNKLTRYVNQDGYICINLKDYLKPQIKLIAKKLECKEYQVSKALFELLHSLYIENKHKKGL